MMMKCMMMRETVEENFFLNIRERQNVSISVYLTKGSSYDVEEYDSDNRSENSSDEGKSYLLLRSTYTIVSARYDLQD